MLSSCMLDIDCYFKWVIENGKVCLRIRSKHVKCIVIMGYNQSVGVDQADKVHVVLE